MHEPNNFKYEQKKDTRIINSDILYSLDKISKVDICFSVKINR